MRWTQDRNAFIILKVAADWDELMYAMYNIQKNKVFYTFLPEVTNHIHHHHLTC